MCDIPQDRKPCESFAAQQSDFNGSQRYWVQVGEEPLILLETLEDVVHAHYAAWGGLLASDPCCLTILL